MRAAYAGAPNADAAIDDVLSFFETVHHLRDWLKNDNASGVQVCELHTLMDNSLHLRLCGDLANGSKHLKLDRKPHTGDLSTGIVESHAKVQLDTGTTAYRFCVASGGEKYDVLQLAEDAVEEWKTFLLARGLI